MYSRADASFAENILLRVSSSGNADLGINEEGTGTSNLVTTGAAITNNNWFFILARWDQANNDRRVEVYNNSMTLVDSVEDTSTAFTAPPALDGHFAVGDIDQTAFTSHYDNCMIGGAYNDPLQDYALMTSYQQTLGPAAAMQVPFRGLYHPRRRGRMGH